MKILFDHNVPKKLRSRLIGHLVLTAKEMGWEELENGSLLRSAEDAGFNLMLTCDQNISYQQNLAERKLALIVLTTNNWARIRPHADSIFTAVQSIEPRGFVVIDIPA